MNMKSRVSNCSGLVLLATLVGAQIAPTSGWAQQQTPATMEAASRTMSAPPPTPPAPPTQTFGGLSFGVGVSLALGVQSNDRVVSASVVNGIVRVNGTGNASAGLILESHYFFVPQRNFFTVPAGAWGHGPFVAIVADTGGTNSNVITAYGLGWMIGLKEPTWTDDGKGGWKATYSNYSWNFGVGVRIDPQAQILGGRHRG
jgi:hypothetical protein